ncbi:LysR family transcriptional regulator [Methylobacterium sp. WSM2598]|uniref:LysR family transcriptional regulator n=1 Tax=Methylobacterium sp. WSM2598 TaxID=398261 RepID=UPI0003A2953F|nr:LysR family transcriptional regulator [Methylobacterium sp. WSM2598]
MRFKGLDLNLLVALDALMKERNLTRAASSLNLSQPAMSAAVARLRAYFRDELFIMRGRKLVLTPRAEELSAPVREALLHIQLAIVSRDTFEPSQSERCFRIALSDFMTVVFFRRVMERLTTEAPDISFELHELADDPDELLRRGEADFLICPELFLSDAHPRASLFTDTLVCVGCRANDKLSRQLTFDSYVSMRHVVAKFGRKRKPSLEEWFLLEHGIKRHIDIVVQSFTMIPHMILGTDRIGTIPLSLARYFENILPLRIVDLPLPFPEFCESVQWPALHNSDPASIWMRDVFFFEACRVGSPGNAA